jgi:16S rRNA pseudouridine516 synthase
MRIDKFLADVNLGTRSEIKKIIKQKRVRVNDEIIRDPKIQVDLESKVYVDDSLITYQRYFYYMLNKPQGVISATSDTSARTVLDLIAKKDLVKDLAPVGRLDKDTTGLLLLTNNGQLAHDLLAPKKHVAKLYQALIAGVVDEQTCESFAWGLILKDQTQLKPAQLEILSVDLNKEQSLIQITISEGKYHQVKRMFGAVGMKVLTLKRLKMGNLTLDQTLRPGQYRPLSMDELAMLKQS